MTGGYCRARGRLSLTMLERLVACAGQCTEQQGPDNGLWYGRRAHLIDCTTLTMADTDENQEQYPQSGTQKNRAGIPCLQVGGHYQ